MFNNYLMSKFNFGFYFNSLKSGLLLLISCSLLAINLNAQCNTLVWADEFDGTSLDLNKWSYTTGNGCGGSSGCGFGNSELQYYTSGTNNITVSGGNLVITAKNQTNYLGSGSNYTSGKISTSGKYSWKYGRMEARIHVPSANAIWPAFWMLSDLNNWPRSGEIDIMETQNANPTVVNQTLHFHCTPCGNNQNIGNGHNNGTNWSSGFHIYAVDWSPGLIRYSVDGVTTVSYTPASLGAKGGTTADWTFDASNFYMILNLAVGGSYTGFATPIAAQYPVSMLVDYVRVYSTSTSLAITGKDLVYTGSNEVYSVNTSGAGATYAWTVPAGASVVSGQGTNQITVNWASGTGGNVSVTVDPDGAGACTSSNISYPVKAITNTCALLLEDFQTNRFLLSPYSNGALTVVANPGAGGSNSSATVGRYARNAGSTYDILGYSNFLVGDPDDFRTGVRQFTMDVRTNAPAGTSITMEFCNSVQMQNAYPDGRHSQYTATTGASNVWTKLTFTYTGSPDAALTGSEVDRLQILFHPNSNVAGEIYYFDNVTAQGVTPTTSAITGLATVCQNLDGVAYSVTGATNSTYAWSASGGATIASGQGTNSVIINFGSSNSVVQVIETNNAMCAGSPVTKNITMSGTCNLVTNFSATPVSSCTNTNITFTDLTTSKIGGETYLWNFGAGATPATSTIAGPVNVSYNTSGQKTVSLTVTNSNGSNAITKTNYITIASPPAGCIFSDEFNNNTVSWLTGSTNFTHTEAGSLWTVSNGGYGEWDNFSYDFNNGVTASPLNFSCGANKPIVQIRAKASANALLRLQLMDGNGRTIDNMSSFNLELTNTYQTFTIDFSKNFRNYYSGSPGAVDSSNISKLVLSINPAFFSFPYTGNNGTYNTYFPGTVDIDWIGVGDNCSPNSGLPVDFLNFKGLYDNHTRLSWSTSSELNNDYFEIERSIDGLTFTSIGKVEGKGTSSSIINYLYYDYSVLSEVTYYRLKQVDQNGLYSYSSIISVIPKEENNEESLSIYPNPCQGNDFVIHTKGLLQGDGTLEIYTILGEKILTKKINDSENSIQGKDLSVTLLPGIYIISQSNSNNKQKLIVN